MLHMSDNSGFLTFGVISLGRNIEGDETICCVQEWQLFLLLPFSPFVIFDS